MACLNFTSSALGRLERLERNISWLVVLKKGIEQIPSVPTLSVFFGRGNNSTIRVFCVWRQKTTTVASFFPSCLIISRLMGSTTCARHIGIWLTTASNLAIHTTAVVRIRYQSMASANGGTYARQHPFELTADVVDTIITLKTTKYTTGRRYGSRHRPLLYALPGTLVVSRSKVLCCMHYCCICCKYLFLLPLGPGWATQYMYTVHVSYYCHIDSMCSGIFCVMYDWVWYI